MGKEKRKTRLTKEQGTGEFVGFAAFAAPVAASASIPTNAPSLNLSPVYTGSDSSMSMLFPRIGQKRDATTKEKALRELRDYFADQSKPKKHQVDALSHFSYLYHSKLHYDNTARVRAATLECFLQAFDRVPKAFKTICQQQQPEILGMIICSRADPAADARLAANQLVERLTGKIDVSEGVWDYVRRILSYGKPKAMYEEIFQKKESPSSLSERQMEELDERYERIVGTAIAGMQHYLQKEFSSDIAMEGDVRFLWRSIAGPKPSLRRKTYLLLSAACQKAPTLIDSDKTSKVLLQALSSEKEPSNIPSLLETLLSFIAYISKEERSATIAVYTKSLAKLFKRGCHGATQWAPTVLPIVAILPQEDQPSVLTCVWEGRKHVAGLAENLEVVSAVAETARFLLLKSHHDFSEVIAKCWLQSLQTCLTTQGTGPAQQSLQKLCKMIGQDWNQLNEASRSRSSSSIYHLKDWFWNEELPKVVLNDNVDNQNLLTVMSHLDSNEVEDTPKYWAQAIKAKFHNLLVRYQGSSGVVPSVDVYELWIAILNSLAVDQIFDKATINKFIMNDLLRWMVIHTSSASDQASAKLTKLDFSIFQLCWAFANTGVWDSILRELLAADCDLKYLDIGLRYMLEAGESAARITSQHLDELCIAVAQGAVEVPTILEDDSFASEIQEEQNRTIANFLKVCCGLGTHEALIESSSIQTLKDIACPSEPFANIGNNPVLEVLVLMGKQRKLDDASLQKISLQSWRQGDVLWYNEVAPWIVEQKELLLQVVVYASDEIKAMISHNSWDAEEEQERPQIWAERAHRLLLLCKNALRDHLPPPNIALVGLADSILWKQDKRRDHESFIRECLIKLLRQIDSIEDRRSLFSNFEGESRELFVTILISLSGASTDILKSASARNRSDSCSILLKEVGANSFDVEEIESWCRVCISRIASALKDRSNIRTCRGISVLSQLVELVFQCIGMESDLDDKLQIDKVKKGDVVWYIGDPKQPSIREECAIVKIHTDLPSEVYFTIKVSRDGTTQERQTVGERLRKEPYDFRKDTKKLILAKDIPSEEVVQRSKFTKMILDELTIPLWEEYWSPHAFELISLIISQCGLFGARGLGSDHHLLFHRLLRKQAKLVEGFDDEGQNIRERIVLLSELTYALGYGCNIPPSSSQLLISFDPIDSVQRLINYYEDLEEGPDDEFDCTVLKWLTLSAASIKDAEQRDQAYVLLFRLAARLFESEIENQEFNSYHFVALKATKAAQRISHTFQSGRSLLEDSEAEALSAMVKAFAFKWEDQLWDSASLFQNVFESSMIHRESLLANASRPCVDKLIECLYTENKQRYSLKLLYAYANRGVPLHSEPPEEINDLTLEKVDDWCKDLIEDECEELEDDVDLVSQWIPQKLMNDIERWYDGEDTYVSEEATAYGRFLSWIVFLQVVEVAAGKESMNRPSFASYVTKCKAVDTILNLAIYFGNVGSDKKVKFEKVIEIDEVLESDNETKLSKLSAFVIFRTIEVFPTIAKTWWEMVCPKYSAQAIREFVETSVSPEILRREMERIKEATSFGEMNVQGSSMSREVTATYMQDDFLLSVVVKLPLSFPFRRAEVDCSKTFGVSENRWKRWALQITQMLNNQGGTVNDALVLWKENVDKEFEGVEPCPVCYSVLHVKTHKLPGVECNTCHNRFHIDCLSQWFRSSGKNDCVLCQQPWSGTRVI